MSVELGDKAKDIVTGYEGICIARTEWLNGCVRITLQSDKLDKDGKPHEGMTFDEPQLKVLKVGKICLPKANPPLLRPPGGPIPAPRQHKGPTRN